MKSNENKEHYSMFFRLSEYQWAEKLFDKGSIKFGTAQKWKDEEEKYGKGRGDKNEGLLCEATGTLMFENGTKILSADVSIRNPDHMQLPIYCLYTLKTDKFREALQRGETSSEIIIPAQYFNDFRSNMFKEKHEKLDDSEELTLVVIKNQDEFIERIKNALIDLGVPKDEILCRPVIYDKEQEQFDLFSTEPEELFHKDSYFEHQSEFRIVVNTRKEKILDYLHNNPIEIGSIASIAIKPIHSPEGFQGLRIVLKPSELDTDS